jgi:hypothetical protein
MSDREPTISEILADLGVTHERDESSSATLTHRLYFAGRFIGHYSAHQVGDLIREHNLGSGALSSHDYRTQGE